MKRKSPNVVSVGDVTLDRNGHRWRCVSVSPWPPAWVYLGA